MNDSAVAEDDFEIPSGLLQAIADEDGGRVVIVIGAGASFEAPTSIPLARECSERAHRKLIADNVLAEGDCEHPEDLSELAEVVVGKTSSQTALVENLPRKEFKMRQPNEGSMLAAAMLREGALSTVLSLNFDLSVQLALGQLGGTEVAVIRGPEDHGSLAAFNFIFLHRSVEADPEDWILTSKDLEEGWADGWPEVIAARVMAAAVTVFAGLGDPAGVLVETSRKVRAAVVEGTRAYQVDPTEHADSVFARELEVDEADYIKTGWCAFMRALGGRLMVMHGEQICEACEQLIESEGWEDEVPDHLAEALKALELIRAGTMRARWLASKEPYAPHRGSPQNVIADLLLAIAMVEKETGSTARLAEDGVVDFVRDGQPIGSLAIRSGRGTTRWSTLESALHEEKIRRRVTEQRPRAALVNAVSDQRPTEVVPPSEVTGERRAGGQSIVDPSDDLIMLSTDELRAEPAQIEAWLN